MHSPEQFSVNPHLSHIYVEDSAWDYPLTKQILSKLPDSTIVKIKHYKDVFNRSHQDYSVQNSSRKLILAVNNGQKIYNGAPVCHDYGEDNFYYLVNAMNCIYDCDYCFLKGMYPSSNLVVFVNVEDYIGEASTLENAYLSVSFDTDLQAMNNITGLADLWCDFADKNKDIRVELRTKSAPSEFRNIDNLIYAFTLTTPFVQERYEKYTADISRRINSIVKAQSVGCKVRLCLDPLIYSEDWKSQVDCLLDMIFDSDIDFEMVRDISIGSFRVSGEYIKQMRKAVPNSALLYYPWAKKDGYCVFPDDKSEMMVEYVKTRLSEVFDDGKIYCI